MGNSKAKESTIHEESQRPQNLTFNCQNYILLNRTASVENNRNSRNDNLTGLQKGFSSDINFCESQTSSAQQPLKITNSPKENSQACTSETQSPASISNLQNDDQPAKSNETMSSDCDIEYSSMEKQAEIEEDCSSQDSYKTALTHFDSIICDKTDIPCLPSTSMNESGDQFENEKVPWTITNFYLQMDKFHKNINVSNKERSDLPPQDTAGDNLVREIEKDMVRNSDCNSPSCQKFELKELCSHEPQGKLNEASSSGIDTSESNLMQINLDCPIFTQSTKNFDARNGNDDGQVLKTHQYITHLEEEISPLVLKPYFGGLNLKRKLSALQDGTAGNPNNIVEETWKVEKGTKKSKTQIVTPLVLRRPSRMLKNQSQKQVEVPIGENRQNSSVAGRQSEFHSAQMNIDLQVKNTSCKEDSKSRHRSLFEDKPSSSSCNGTPHIKDNERRCYEVLSPKSWSPAETSTHFKLQSKYINKDYKLNKIDLKPNLSFTESSHYLQFPVNLNVDECVKSVTPKSQLTSTTNSACEYDYKQSESESVNKGGESPGSKKLTMSRSLVPKKEMEVRRNPGRKAKENAFMKN